MKQDGFAWWKRRFAQMSCYFDAFRIDHILGFFRIWSIPRTRSKAFSDILCPPCRCGPDEFAARGIAFDRERFTRPFINDAVLSEIFGNRAESVKREFLNPAARGTYSLKPEFATQRDVERHFAALAEDQPTRGSKKGCLI